MIPASFQIRDLTIRPAAVLAPMAGVTDTLFRRVIRGLGGCGLLMTEFTSSEGITRSAKKTLRYLYFQEDEHPITAQLFGANPAVMAEAAKMVEDLGYDAVDINLGCPAKKVVKCGGSGLLRDLPLLEDIFRSVRAAVKIPLTVKLRAGWDENSIVAVDVAKMAEDIGVEGVAVHPRTREQGYTGAADWSLIAAVKQAVKIPVIGNGDIAGARDVERRMKCGVRGVMLGRAAMCGPWVFREIRHFLDSGENLAPPSLEEQWAHILRHCRWKAEREGSELHAMQSMRTRLMAYSRGMPEAKRLRERFAHVASIADLAGIAEENLAHTAASALTISST